MQLYIIFGTRFCFFRTRCAVWLCFRTVICINRYRGQNMLNIFPYLKKYYSHKKLCWYFGTHTCMVNFVPGHVGYQQLSQTNVYTYVYRNSLISYNESRSCSHGVVGHLNRTCPGFCKDIELDGTLNFEYLFGTYVVHSKHCMHDTINIQYALLYSLGQVKLENKQFALQKML